MILERVHVPDHRRPPATRWPMSVPAVAQLADEGLDLTASVTFLVGENGSGKSTIIEAVAEQFSLDAQGGRANRTYGNDREPTLLGGLVAVELGPEGHRWRVGLLQRLAASGSQVVVATHSPVLTALPGADVVELGEHGIRHTAWDDLDLVAHWRGYLDAPQRYLRHLLDDDPLAGTWRARPGNRPGRPRVAVVEC